MKKIKCFIAGSKQQNRQREILTSVLGKVPNRHDVYFEIKTYLDFEGRLTSEGQQAAYNQYIRSKADLVVFVFDKGVGEHTIEEFIVALKSLLSHKHPEILVYFNKSVADHPQLKTMQLMMDQWKNYYCEYETDEELKALFKDEIDLFVHRRKQSRSIKLFPFCKFNLRGIRSVLSVVLLLALFSILGAALYSHIRQSDRNNHPILLIAGGGSAANFVELNYPAISNLNRYEKGVYVHMPSSDAWSLLTEEVITKQEKRRYYPVCLSAEAIADSFFLKAKSRESFINDASILCIKLGMDTLAVYMKNDVELMSYLSDKEQKTITTSELANLLTKRTDLDLGVFTTSPNSGTRHTYEKALEPCSFNLKDFKTELFSEESDWPAINKVGKSYILLGSTCYFMRDMQRSVKEKKTLRLLVMDNNAAPVGKPIYLYCMAYRNENSNVLELPKETLQFLTDLNVDFSKVVKDGKIKRDKENIILGFSDLECWQ